MQRDTREERREERINSMAAAMSGVFSVLYADRYTAGVKPSSPAHIQRPIAKLHRSMSGYGHRP